MVRRGYMDGMGGGLFGVNGTMTRGQMVTILYRIAGKPSVEGLENPFRDVAEGRYLSLIHIWSRAARRPSPLHGPLRWKTALSPFTTTAPTWL